MIRNTLRNFGIGCLLLTVATAALVGAAPGAHASGLGPTITALPDSAAYGVVEVWGNGFSAGGAVTIQVLNTATGVVLDTVSTTAARSGTYMKTFALPSTCAVQAAQQVTIQATDASNTLSNSVVMALPTPVSLAQGILSNDITSLQTLYANPPIPYALSSTWEAWYLQLVTISTTIAQDNVNLAAARSTQQQGAAACAA